MDMQKPVDRSYCSRINVSDIMLKKLIFVILICAIVSMLFGFGSIVVAHGSWVELIKHQYFWHFYMKSVLWFFSACTIASIIVSVAFSKMNSGKKGKI